MKKILVSGVRATGSAHIGNYLGAIKQFVKLQDEYDCYFFVADLHALTTPFEPGELKNSSLEVVAEYLAAGLDPQKSHIFLQSHIPEHVELSWIFNCITPIGELERMTQFKEKSEQHKQNINAGLLNYPVLMAADILIYNADVVPVGEDQIQHLELTRTVARKFNNKFGKVFVEPKPLLNKDTGRIKSLTHPEKKMSKTGDEALLIADEPKEILRKLKKAVTATDAKGKSAGVENLFVLLREFGTKEQIKNFENAFADNSIKFSDLKETLAQQISEHFADFRNKKKHLLDNPEIIARALSDGSKHAKIRAQQIMSEVKKKVGLV